MKKAIALRLLKSKKVRQLALKALKNDKVRKTIMKQVGKQVSRRLGGK